MHITLSAEHFRQILQDKVFADNMIATRWYICGFQQSRSEHIKIIFLIEYI